MRSTTGLRAPHRVGRRSLRRLAAHRRAQQGYPTSVRKVGQSRGRATGTDRTVDFKLEIEIEDEEKELEVEL